MTNDNHTGSEDTDHLDWRDNAHWNRGRKKPCRYCGQIAFLLDDLGRPAHKVCTEQHHTDSGQNMDALTHTGGAA